MSIRESAYQAAVSYLSAFDLHDLFNLKLYRLMREEMEKGLFEAVLEKCGYNQSWAADVLGLSRNNLRAKIQQLGISMVPHKQRRGAYKEDPS